MVPVFLTAVILFSAASVRPVHAQAWPDIIGQTFGVTFEKILDTIERVIIVSVKNQVKRSVARELQKTLIKKSDIIVDWQEELFGIPRSEGRIFANNLVTALTRSGSMVLYETIDDAADSFGRRFRAMALSALDSDKLEKPVFEDYAGGGGVDPRTGRLNPFRQRDNLAGFTALYNPSSNFLVAWEVERATKNFIAEKSKAIELRQTGSPIKAGRSGVPPKVKEEAYAKLVTFNVADALNAENMEDALAILTNALSAKAINYFKERSEKASREAFDRLVRQAINYGDADTPSMRNY